jgi:hypothetical protein
VPTLTFLLAFCDKQVVKVKHCALYIFSKNILQNNKKYLTIYPISMMMKAETQLFFSWPYHIRKTQAIQFRSSLGKIIGKKTKKLF